MRMLEHRLQILLDEERHARIASVARERGVSHVIPDAAGIAGLLHR
jgi:hypothetical protein